MSLQIKQREYQKLIQETRKNVALLDEDIGSDQHQEENKNLKERYNLLSEENHILFEQVTLLRAHHDQFNKETTEKLADAEAKASRFDFIKS